MAIDITPLKINDRVALVCPGSICTAKDHPSVTQHFLQEHYGLQAEISPETIQSSSAQQRAQYLLKYLLADDIKLIAALRGGAGSADTIPFLHQYQQQLQAARPKCLLGFSDITALLIYFAQHYRWPVIHGASVLQFAQQSVDAVSQQVTMDLLFAKSTTRPGLTQLQPLNAAARVPTTLHAELTGGCLSLIDISIKDIWEIDTDNKIIFLEDCNEKAHKIVRTLNYFARIGLLTHAKAVIFGDFTCKPIGVTGDEQERNRLAILNNLANFAALQSLPILYTPQFGHGKTNLPLLYCQSYQLHLGNNAYLQLEI